MAKFALLLQEKPGDFAAHDPETFAGIIQEYEAWRNGLVRAGRYLGAHKLTYDGGRRLRRRGDDVRVTDGPYSEAKEVLGGLFVIEADDYDHAVRIASDCPHLVHSQCIDVRALDFLGIPEIDGEDGADGEP